VAGARFGELREAVHALERRLRPEAPASAPATAPDPSAGAATAAPAIRSTLFDYVGFERRFRGDPDVIVDSLEQRYGDLLADSPPVVDLGCGRGELLQRQLPARRQQREAVAGPRLDAPRRRDPPRVGRRRDGRSRRAIRRACCR